MGFKIQKNVKVPGGTSSNRIVYPFGQMNVGDSFWCERYQVRSSAAQYGRRHGMVFSVRIDGDGFRCWRTK